jgi:hypothetical protein
VKFAVPAPRAMGVAWAENLQLDFERLAGSIERNVPAGRDRALAITKLEESWLWALTGIDRG